MVKTVNKYNMKSLAEADRPREKLIACGRRNLSDAELLAILINSGNSTENSVGLSHRILSAYHNDLFLLGRASVAELCKFNGIGKAKALSIIAGLEIARRVKKLPQKKSVQITGSKEVFELMHPVFLDLNHEEFWIVILNTANYVISKQMISRGGRSGTVADPKIIFATALAHKAAFVVLTHNHPSGNLEPSKEDILITKKLINAGRLLDLLVLDHVIITNTGYCSLADKGII